MQVDQLLGLPRSLAASSQARPARVSVRTTRERRRASSSRMRALTAPILWPRRGSDRMRAHADLLLRRRRCPAFPRRRARRRRRRCLHREVLRDVSEPRDRGRAARPGLRARGPDARAPARLDRLQPEDARRRCRGASPRRRLRGRPARRGASARAGRVGALRARDAAAGGPRSALLDQHRRQRDGLPPRPRRPAAARAARGRAGARAAAAAVLPPGARRRSSAPAPDKIAPDFARIAAGPGASVGAVLPRGIRDALLRAPRRTARAREARRPPRRSRASARILDGLLAKATASPRLGARLRGGAAHRDR